MKDGTGYLIPTNVTPSDKDCVTFFFPNDPAYRRIIIGHYQELGYWFNWERDENKTGRIVANLWKDCIEMSHECDYMPAINVYNEINTGDVSCGGTTVVVNNEIGPAPVTITYGPNDEPEEIEPNDTEVYADDGITPLPPPVYQPNYPDWASFNVAKCRAANFYAGNIDRQLRKIRFIFDNFVEAKVTNIVTAIGLALSDGPSPVLDVAAIVLFIVPSIINWIKDKSGDVSDIAAFILVYDKCEITQIIYSATSKQNLGDALADYLVLKLDEAGVVGTTKVWLEKYIRFVYGNRFANWAFDNIDNVVPASTPIECPCIDGNAASLFYDFNDGTLQGWVYSTTPYPADNNPGALTTDAIEGTHSIDLDVLGSWNNAGGFSGGTWIRSLPSTVNIQDGDDISFLYDYVGVHVNYAVISFRFGPVEQLVKSIAQVTGPQSAQTKVIAVGVGEGGFQCDEIRIRLTESGIGGGAQAGKFRLDEIAFTFDDL